MGFSYAALGGFDKQALGRVTLTALVVVLSHALSACHIPSPSGSALAVAGGECKGDTKPPPPNHRLSNSEYDTTIQDLLGTKRKYSGIFPPDQIANGFDTAAEAHVISATMAESYLDAARQLSKEYAEKAVADCRSEGGGGEDVACLDAALREVAEKAFRRPLLSDESRQIGALAQNLRRDGSSTREAFEAGLAGVLMAPQFLFRINAADSVISNADQYALASRLSYFLWSSMPDGELLELAKAGTLKDPAVVRKAAVAMLKDAKADAFSRNFVGQWLGIRKLAARAPSGKMDAALLEDFQTETLRYVSEYISKNINVKDLLDGDFSYLNARLSKYYGLPAVSGDFERVELKGPQRRGLLTQAAFLVSTSNPDATSPVKRGKWVLDNILCAPPPPPPPGVETLESKPGSSKLPIRERLAEHSKSSACAGCHKMMDPVGLAFENYDAFGIWRDADDAGTIDPSGKLPDGRAFASSAELTELLASSPELPRCVALKLATYALGRVPSGKEICIVDAIAKKSQDESYGLQDMIVDIAVELLAP